MLEWVREYRRADLAPDIVAGLTGAAILVPQSMAYATIGGLPPVVGMYASVVPVLVYALFGWSRQLSVGPLATISIIGAVALARLAPPAQPSTSAMRRPSPCWWAECTSCSDSAASGSSCASCPSR